MQAMDTERSPGLPSLMLTTRRRLMPQGTSCSFLQAVTQALHSMQRSASQRTFIRAMPNSSRSPDLTERRLGLLHAGRRIVAVSGDCVVALTEHDRICPLWILPALIDTWEPTGKVVGHPHDSLADPLCDKSRHAGSLAALHFRTPDMN